MLQLLLKKSTIMAFNDMLWRSVVRVISEKCKKCLACVEVCPMKAISEEDGKIVINKDVCLECGCCASACANDAIEFE